MPPELRKRLETLLLSLPEWEQEESRGKLLYCLRPYRMWDHLDASGTRVQASKKLLDLEAQFGCEPFEALLGELRQRYSIHTARAEEIDKLREDLRRLARRPVQKWDREPYLGLTYFDRGDAPIFFGRDLELAELVKAITETEQGKRFLVVAGASGSGKSSLLRAGLWAGLEAGRLAQIPGSRDWLISAMMPSYMGTPTASLRAGLQEALQGHAKFRQKLGLAAGVDQKPLQQLAEQLLGPDSPREARWLLLIDQLEELFGMEMEKEAVPFLDRVIAATQPDAEGKPSRFQVIATLRSDFLGHCANHAPLMRVLNSPGGQFLLGAPNRVGMERMVSGPIQELELGEPWWLDPALPGIIATEAQQHSGGGLALMAFALQELYEQSRATLRLDAATYQGPDFGGLGGAIARRAEATLAEVPEDASHAFGRVFLRLLRVRPGEAATRRREQLSAWARDEMALDLIQALVRARLLVAATGPTGEAVVEVAHEALLREWPRLARWIEERKQAFGLMERVLTEADAWMSGPSIWRCRRPWQEDQIEETRLQLKEAGLLERTLQSAHAQRFLMPKVDWWVEVELASAGTTPLRRAEIGRLLAEANDPRPGVGLVQGVPEIVWCAVPGGAVKIEGHGDFPVQALDIAKYPVTVGQFLAFVEAKDGFCQKGWWENLEHRAPDEDWKAWRNNEPIRNVSWYDAVAYCRWLTKKLAYEVRLPTECEWQWAAQSATEAFRFPWGVDWKVGAANTLKAEIGRVAAVGLFPDGDSKQGVSDLCGNVWEWCLNRIEKADDTDVVYRRSRALRGGSWNDLEVLASAGYRGFDHPVNRDSVIGFRVVRSSPHPLSLAPLDAGR